jgi:hypothetical protein
MSVLAARNRLVRALDKGDPQELFEAIRGGATLDCWVQNWNAPPVSVALRNAMSCHVLVRELLNRGASATQLDNQGLSPLYWAFAGHTAGADPHANAARMQAIALLREEGGLREQGGGWYNHLTDPTGALHSLVHLAALSNFTQGIQWLAGLGFAVDAPNSNGSTPLHLTLHSPESAGILMGFGADPDTPDASGKVIHEMVEKKGAEFFENWTAVCEKARLHAFLPQPVQAGMTARRL